MKNVFITKDAYLDNSVRVNYFEKDKIFKKIKFEFNEETKKMEKKEVEEVRDELLFCERLTWENEELELDSVIEIKRVNFEKE